MKPKFKELENQVIISGTEKSTIKEITICIGEHEWDHDRKPGSMKVIYTFVDGKFCSELDYNKFRNAVDYSDKEICLRSSASGTAIVLISDLSLALKKLTEKNPSDTEIQLRRINKGIEYALLRGNNLRASLLKKKNNVDVKSFILNLRDVKVIEKALLDVFSEKREEYVKRYNKLYESKVLAYEEELLAGKGQSISRIMYNSSTRYGKEKSDFAHRFFVEERVNSYPYTYTIKKVSTWKKICLEHSRAEVKAMEEGFMAKNLFKIGTIVNNKNNFKFVRVLKIQTGAFGFEGEFLIGFKDQSSFVVRSQAVFAEGPIVSGHYRYPTTFHVVQYPNGKVVQKHSEEEMVNQFSKTK